MRTGTAGQQLQATAALVLLAIMGALAACGPRAEEAGATAAVAEQAAPATASPPASTAGPLSLVVTGAQTDGQRCVLSVQARNDTGAAALNVQAAWMAQTDGFGFISDYQVLGDFAAGEERVVQFSIVGAPCAAVQRVELSRAVCTVGPVETPPRSCAERVTLDARGWPSGAQ